MWRRSTSSRSSPRPPVPRADRRARHAPGAAVRRPRAVPAVAPSAVPPRAIPTASSPPCAGAGRRWRAPLVAGVADLVPLCGGHGGCGWCCGCCTCRSSTSGSVWYGFGWESLLLEAGFLAIFLGQRRRRRRRCSMLWLLRWLLFRVEFGAGLIKLRGDPCWRDLTCLDYHHETQPMPGPLSWFFHRLPKPAAPRRGRRQPRRPAGRAVRPVRPAAGRRASRRGIVIVTQLWLVLSRQLRLAELADDRARVRRRRRRRACARGAAAVRASGTLAPPRLVRRARSIAGAASSPVLS